MDITQIPGYVEISCENYISRLLKSHGWDTAPKLVPDKVVATTAPAASLSMQNINCVQIENHAIST